MYEMIRVMAGVEPEGIAWERVRIAPHTMDVKDLQGRAATPKGTIAFRYENRNGIWRYYLTLPKGMEVDFCYPDGRMESLTGGNEYEL